MHIQAANIAHTVNTNINSLIFITNINSGVGDVTGTLV